MRAEMMPGFPGAIARLTHAMAGLPATGRFTHLHARLYRATGGRIMPSWFFGAPVLVLEVVGRKSGRIRSTPLIYARYGNTVVVSASNAGAAQTPSWWLNLRDAGWGQIWIGRRHYRVRPRLLTGRERQAAWQLLAATYPALPNYTSFTERELPVIALDACAEPSPDAIRGADHGRYDH
jgi:F420H(2)-dependent quinone reductase